MTEPPLNTGQVFEELRPSLPPGLLWYRNEQTNTRLLVYPGAERVLSVEARSLDILEHTNGSNTVSTIASQIGASTEEIKASARELGHAVCWQEPPSTALLKAAMRLRLEHMAAWEPTPGQANAHYHASEIKDAQEQFDSIETTVSHIFSCPHEALNHLTYGGALCEKLVKMGSLRPGCRVLEIGGGTGRLTRDLLNHLSQEYSEIYESLDYTLLDLSPALQNSQKELCSHHRPRIQFVSADIEKHDFGDSRFNLILSNEVIADLSVDVAQLERLSQPESEAEHQIARYELDVCGARPRFVINTGAIRLLERIPDLLTEDASAVFTEFGSTDESPLAVPLGGHREHSIQFGHLLKVAQRLGLRSELKNLGRWLNFNPETLVLPLQVSKLLLESLLPELDIKPPPLSLLTPFTLKEALQDEFGRIGNLQFLPMPEAGFSPFKFKVLSLGNQNSAP